MASHDGKRRSHQRFLRNLPKQKPGKYLKSCTLLSGGSRPCAREGEDGEVFCRLPYRLLFPLRFLFFFFFFTKIRKGEADWVPQASPLDPALLLQE